MKVHLITNRQGCLRVRLFWGGKRTEFYFREAGLSCRKFKSNCCLSSVASDRLHTNDMAGFLNNLHLKKSPFKLKRAAFCKFPE